jgi:hypothetical protein
VDWSDTYFAPVVVDSVVRVDAVVVAAAPILAVLEVAAQETVELTVKRSCVAS